MGWTLKDVELGDVMGNATAAQRIHSVAAHLMSPHRSSLARPHRVSIIGSGNWGSAIGKILAENTRGHADLFEPTVRMWVYEEIIEGQKLSHLINERHENVKYLPGVQLPANLWATNDIVEAVDGASIIVINVPHQFVSSICKDMKGHISPMARAISCIKGISVSPNKIHLFSNVIAQQLGIYCGALSGANIATEVAQEKWSETTIAYNDPNPGPIDGATMRQLFHRPYFHVRVVSDVAGVEISGALKNVVAMAAGFVEGLGWGDNAKAAVMRVGLLEMVKFSTLFFPASRAATFTEESPGVADLITSSSSGRNFRCAREFVRTGKDIETIEREMLNGQKLQGTTTAKELHEFLSRQGQVSQFPLHTAVYRILYEGLKPQDLPSVLDP